MAVSLVERASQLRLRRQGLESSSGRHDSPAGIGKADAVLALHQDPFPGYSLTHGVG